MTMTDPIVIGPLTAEEWASLFLVNGEDGDDERNPLPACCGPISNVRGALADVLRIGGLTELGQLRLAPVWDDIYGCLDRDEVMANPVLRKLYDAYVAGRDPVPDDAEAYEQFRAKPLDQVKQMLDTVDHPDSLFQLDTREGRMHALVRMAGAFVAYVVDDDERQEAAFILAEKLGMDPVRVCLVVDVLRQDNRLPFRTTLELDRHVDETSVR